MSIRVTADEVKQIIDTTLTDTEIDAFITAASLIIDEYLSTNTDLVDALKTELEKWLTAHLIASTRERQTISEKAGQAEAQYTGKLGMGLDLTTYGQMVKLLDTTGILSNQIGKRKASMYAVITEADAGELAHD